MPDNLNLGIRFTADGKGLVGEIRGAKKELDKLTGSTQQSAQANRTQARASTQAKKEQDRFTTSTQKTSRANKQQTGTARQSAQATQTQARASTRAKQAQDRMAGSTDRASQANRRYSKTAQQAQKATDKTGTSFQKTHNSALKYFALAGGISGVVRATRATIRHADAYTNISNAVRIATKSLAEQRTVQEELFAIAQRIRAPFTAVADLYQKLSISADELEASNQDLLAVIEGVGQALVINGTDATAASGALLQFSQALGSDVVRAEELNSVLDAAKPILIAVANNLDSAGGSVSKLRQQVAAGEITNREFFDALKAGLPELQANFDLTNSTIGQGVVQVDNSLTRLIGRMDETLVASVVVAGGLEYLAKAIADTDADELAEDLKDIAQVSGYLLLGFLTRAGIAYSIFSVKQALGARGTKVFSAVTLTAKQRVRGLGLGLTYGATAMATYSAAVKAATVLTRGLGVAMRFLAGPGGLLILAAYAAYEFATANDDAKDSLDGLPEDVDAYRESLERLTRAQILRGLPGLEDAVTQAKADLASAQQEHARLLKDGDVGASFAAGSRVDAGLQELNDAQAGIDDSRARLESANERLNTSLEALSSKNPTDETDATAPQAATEAYLKLQKSLQTEEQKINATYEERIKILANNQDKAVDPEQLATARARVTAERDAALAAIDKTKADEAARASAAALRQANESGLPALAALQQRQRELGEVVDLSATSLQRQADITRATHRVQKNYATATDETRQAIVDLIVGNAEQERGLQRTASAYQLITGGADAYRQQLAAIREAADLVVDDPATAQNERTAALRQANLESERLYQEHLIEAKRLGWEAEILEAEGHYSRVEAATLAHKSRVIDIESGGFNKVASVRKGFADYEAKQATATRKQKAVSALAIAKESLGAVAGQNKKLFQLQQAAGIAQAIISIHTGVATALQKPPPLGFIEGALIAVAGAAEIAAIRSQQPPQAFALGGIVDRPTFFSASNVARGVAGEAGPEAIIPLRRGRGGRLGIEAPAGGATVNLGVISLGDVIVQGGVGSEETVSAVITQLQERLRPAVQEILAGELRPGGQLNRTNVAAA